MCSCMRWLEQIYFFNFSFLLLLLLLLLLLSSPTKGSVAELKVNRCFMSFNLSVVAAATVIAVKSAVVSRPTSAVVCFHFDCCCYYFVNVIFFCFVFVYMSRMQFLCFFNLFLYSHVSFAFTFPSRLAVNFDLLNVFLVFRVLLLFVYSAVDFHTYALESTWHSFAM